MIPPELEQAVRDLDRHVSSAGWDQPTRLFAIAETSELLDREPSLATQLAGSSASHRWTTVEQDGVSQRDDLDQMLGEIAWPDTVAGAAISTERTMVPPSDANSETAPESSHHEVRITMAVLRDGSRCTALRLRAHDSDDSIVVGEDLISGLGDLLVHTLT